MPASTEKKRSRGVRKAGDRRADSHGDAEGDGDEEREHRADGDAREARPDMGEERSVPDGLEPGPRNRGDIREDLRVDVEDADQHRPKDKQHQERRQKLRTRDNASSRPHAPDHYVPWQDGTSKASLN